MNINELIEKAKAAQEQKAKEAEIQSRIFKLEMRIGGLKSNLRATDYKAIKYAEGELSAEEYAETREQRRAWRAEINALEEEIKAIKEGANEN